MREGAKILVGNREVAKRYIGSRLVWENRNNIKISEVAGRFLGSSWIEFSTFNIKSQLKGKKITNIRLYTGKEITVSKRTSFEYSIDGNSLYLGEISEVMRSDFENSGLTDNTRYFDVTFYYE